MNRISTRAIFITALLVSVAGFLFVVLQFDKIPADIPMQTDFDGNVNWSAPKSVKNATYGVWFSALMTLLLWLAVPRPQLAQMKMPVTSTESSDNETDSIPFSHTAADKAERLLTRQQRAMAWLALAQAISTAVLQPTLSLPSYDKYNRVSFVLFAVLTGAAVINLIRDLVQWQDVYATMATDEEEKRRNKHFRYGAAIGFYKEPADPMVMHISPFNHGKVDMNWAHRPIRMQILALIAAIIIIVVTAFI